jgi:hypothetical protein
MRHGTVKDLIFKNVHSTLNLKWRCILTGALTLVTERRLTSLRRLAYHPRRLLHHHHHRHHNQLI